MVIKVIWDCSKLHYKELEEHTEIKILPFY